MIDRYFDFLRSCLSERAKIPSCVNDMDWQGLFRFGKEQALLGILYDGVKRLPNGTISDVSLLAKWTVAAQQITHKNTEINVRCHNLQEILTNDGYRSCILKGQGIAQLYPNPAARTPGDIDVWVAPANKWKERYPYRKQICEYVEQHTPGQKARYHHIDFPIFKDVPVEVHFTPSYMYAPWHNKRLQRWFERNADLQFSNNISISEGVWKINAPTISFNLVYILSHLYRHVFSEGIGLRQMLDYYYVLLNADNCMREVARRDIKHLGMKRFATAVMWLQQEVFGLAEEYLLFAPNEKEGRFLLNEVLIGGNFGKYDTRLGDKEKEHIWHRYFRMNIRNMRFVKHYPFEALCEPIFRTWQAIKEKFR